MLHGESPLTAGRVTRKGTCRWVLCGGGAVMKWQVQHWCRAPAHWQASAELRVWALPTDRSIVWKLNSAIVASSGPVPQTELAPAGIVSGITALVHTSNGVLARLLLPFDLDLVHEFFATEFFWDNKFLRCWIFEKQILKNCFFKDLIFFTLNLYCY